jgi:D-lactate dehydrogenase
MAHRIAFLETAAWEQPYLAKKLPRPPAVYLPDELDKLKSFAKIADCTVLSVFVNSQVTAASLAKLPKLKFIATRSTGFDHIDLAACAKRGIKVSNVPSYGENTVAEHGFALLLALAHRIPEANARARDGNWSFDGLRGFDLRGKTIGIIGMGRIGAHAAAIAAGFGMQVLAYDPRRNPKLAKQLGFRYVTLRQLLKASDVVTLHTLLTPATRHLLNASTIKLMKPSAVLINTARGGLVDTKALVAALLKGKLAGAGLDVLEEEELMKDPRQLLTRKLSEKQMAEALPSHVLLTLPNVVVTPHNAFNTTEAIQRILDTTVANIKSFVAGKPANLVGAK